MSVPRRLVAFLDLAAEDLAATEVLLESGNRCAAYHCQQVVEKLTRAVLLARGIEAGAEHRLDVLLARLPEDDRWRSTLRPFEHYTAFATSYRYPTPGGRIPAAPDPTKIQADAEALRALLGRARSEFPAPARGP